MSDEVYISTSEPRPSPEHDREAIVICKSCSEVVRKVHVTERQYGPIYHREECARCLLRMSVEDVLTEYRACLAEAPALWAYCREKDKRLEEYRDAHDKARAMDDRMRMLAADLVRAMTREARGPS